MADTSDVQLAFANDATPNAALPGGIAWQVLNFVSEDFAPNSDSTQSRAIRPDASVKDSRRTRESQQGTLSMELSRDPEVDVLLAAALRGTWVSNVLKGGVGKTQLVFEEKVLEGASPFYTRYRGVMLNGFSLEASDGLVDIRFPVMGLTGEDAVAATATSTYVAAGSAAVLAAVDFTGFNAGSYATQLDCASVSFDLTNNGRADPKMGSRTPRSIAWGKRTTTISASLYFKDHEAYQDFKADLPTSIAFGFTTPGATSGLSFGFGRCRWTSFSKPIAGENQTIMVAVELVATFDPTSATDFAITRTV